uniref:Uncharacterized protein n=1 Tax=Pipistrellus kuhlii TaxID=59472 RepID=A0A7J7XB90_PIPKU|nr:hypothetical protein mPipKuh1_010637 [Pipistrellus kuhlii]
MQDGQLPFNTDKSRLSLRGGIHTMSVSWTRGLWLRAPHRQQEGAQKLQVPVAMSHPSVAHAARTSITCCAAGSPASKCQPPAAVTKMVLPVNRSHYNSIDIVNNDTNSPSCAECLLCNPFRSKEAVLPFRIA